MLVQHSADLNILNENEESIVDVCIQTNNFKTGSKLLAMDSFQLEKSSKQNNNLLHRLGKAVLDEEGRQLI